MANIQIPNLPAVAALSGEELFEGVQAGSSVKISLGQMIAAARTGLPTTVPLPVSAGGTGTTTSTGTGSVVLSNGPTVSFALGTFGAPSINFTGDTNTGIWSPGADTVAVSTAGAERMRITSTGIVGVGTATPSSFSTKLAVIGGNLGVSEDQNTLTTIRASSNICNIGAFNATGASLAFRTAPSGSGEVERMRIHPTGGVSIGNTTDPGTTNLSVTGVGSFGLGTAALPSQTFNGDTNTGIYSPGADTISISTAGVQRFSIGSTGNVSMLAVSTEDRSLEVGINRSGDGNSFIDLIGDATYTDYGSRFIRVGGANGSTSIQHRGTGGLLLVAQEAAPILFSTSNTERYRVGPLGQWGIGGANWGTAGQAFISGGPSAATSWGTLGLAGGGTGVTTAPAAAAVLMGYTATATAAGTTVLTNTSSQYQLFTGSTTQTITLPVTSTLTTGWTFHIVNSSTGNLTINSSGGNLVATVIPGTTVMVTCILTSGTTAASWEFGVTDFNTLTGTGSVVMSNSPTLVTPALGTGSFDLGAVATPSITFTGDPNTGIWSPAADTIAASTGGAERARIDSAGNITQSNAVSGSGAIVGEQTFRLAADGAAIGPTIADFFGPSSAISLEASSVYEVTIYAVFNKTTAGTATWTLTASSAPTRMVGTYQASPITGIAAGAPTTGFTGSQGAATAAFAATGSLSTAVNHAYQFKVQIQTNAATNFRLQITQSLGTATPLAGSYYTVKKISATTGTFVA